MNAIDRLKASLCLAIAAVALLVVAAPAQAAARSTAGVGVEVKPPQTPKVQPVAGQPATDKPEMGPPDPSKRVHQPLKGGASAPQPTVQLKPGEVPAIVFDTPQYNFGRIPAGEAITHDFWFTNTGNGPLEIVSARPS